MLDISEIVHPLPIAVDADLLRQEYEKFVLSQRPDLQRRPNNYSKTFAITNVKSTPHDSWFSQEAGVMKLLKDPATNEEVLRLTNKWTLGYPGPRRDNLMAYYPNGVADKDLIHWHPDMIDTEMHRLASRIKEYLGIDYNLRCRLSVSHGQVEIDRHLDPHTPWRVHVALDSGSESHWTFYDEVGSTDSIKWKQPKDTVWLVRTGDVQHSVFVPSGEYRLQLFYHVWHRDLPINLNQ
jgi:hypothetical protein